MISMKILVADDDAQMQVAVTVALQQGGHEVVVVSDGEALLDEADKGSWDIIITDDRMPRLSGTEVIAQLVEKGNHTPLLLMTAYGDVSKAVEAIQCGASDFLSKPFSADELLRVVSRVMILKDAPTAQRLKKGPKQRPIITNDPGMVRLLEVAEAVAQSDVTILLQGESGTGKELIARLVHFSSPRRSQPFVAVNCAALPETLLESELFGHEKGAFTGAQSRKIGKFELAHGGTILLDEISEMALPLQAKLLRVLQEREVDRVGGTSPVSIDVRVVATTNRNLEGMIQSGTFRADLYYRLNVIPLYVPPLRTRKGDVRLLVEHFMRLYLGESRPLLNAETLSALEEYPWPGNIRELQNAVQRAAILSGGRTPVCKDFLLSGRPLSNDEPINEAERHYPVEVIGPVSYSTSLDEPSLRSGMTVEEMERKLILHTLKATQDNRSQAAKLLGISIRTLRNKLHEYRSKGFTSE
jgi:DNA-binding NtrC family response regulator